MSSPDPEVLPAEAEPRPRRRSPWRRVAILVTMIVVVAVVAVGALIAVQVRRPLPQTGGEIQVSGLDAQVKVLRDAQGVPQIYADSATDLFRAQGYVQAQERFFQMDVRRHFTSGRLAELLGDNETAIKADKMTRTLGWRHVAEQEYDALDKRTKDYLQAYADGVNAYLDGRSTGSIAIEYTILSQRVDVAQPEPWTPVDSLAWLKAMAWDLKSNYDDELARAEIYAQSAPTTNDQRVAVLSKIDELFPSYPASNRTILQANENRGTPVAAAPGPSAPNDALDAQAHAALASAKTALDAIPAFLGKGEGIGSNSWAVSGKLTASGQPMLANDPHLSLTAPGVWSQVGLHCTTVTDSCPFDVAGFSFAGFPGVIIGHNSQVAWGLTNMGADVTDFFVERVRDGGYLSGSDWQPLEIRTETIKVNGGQDITIGVKSTKHGPIISGVLDGVDAAENSPAGDSIGDHVVSLGWTALSPGHTAEAVFGFDRAQSVDDIRAAAAQFDVPAQNIVFATKDGRIGYQAPGRIPVRRAVPDGAVPSDGSWPRPGYDPRYDWDGYVSFDQMPWTLDPADGIVVAANQAVLPAGEGPFLTKDWDYGYRSQRIRELLEAKVADGQRITAETMATIQNDTYSPYAAALVSILVDQDLTNTPVDQGIANAFADDGQELLRHWDYRMDPDSAAAAYFAAVWRNILRFTFWDDLPKDARPDGGSQWLAVVINLLNDPKNNTTSSYWDDRGTFGVVEGRDEILTKSLVVARQDLTVDLGKDTSDWSWGALHQLTLNHEVLSGSGVPGVVAGLLAPGPVGVGGGSSIVNATSWDAASDPASFAVTSGPSMRMVVDLGELDKSTWVTATGVSGHPASSHYEDQLDAWVAGDSFAWPFTKAAVRAGTKDELTLAPEGTATP